MLLRDNWLYGFVLKDPRMLHVKVSVGFESPDFVSLVYKHSYTFCTCNGYISISALLIQYNIRYILHVI